MVQEDISWPKFLYHDGKECMELNVAKQDSDNCVAVILVCTCHGRDKAVRFKIITLAEKSKGEV